MRDAGIISAEQKVSHESLFNNNGTGFLKKKSLNLILKRLIKNSNYEKYIQRTIGRLRSKKIRRWLHRHYCGFYNYLDCAWTMQLI
jgi:hypothetical protein